MQLLVFFCKSVVTRRSTEKHGFNASLSRPHTSLIKLQMPCVSIRLPDHLTFFQGHFVY